MRGHAIQMAKKLSTYERQMAARIGAAVREQREVRDMKREVIAQILGDEYDSIAKKERGERQFSASDIARLALEWDCPTDLLIFGQSRPKLLRRVQVDFTQQDVPAVVISRKPEKPPRAH